MKTATEHIREMNDHTRAWIAEDPENRWAGLLVEDAEHWAKITIEWPDGESRPILTAEGVDRYLAMVAYSDIYKDVMGCRPRHDIWRLSTEEIEAKITALCESER